MATRYGLFTKLTPEEVLRRAEGFFGPDGLGLTRRQVGPNVASFVGGGGGVTLSVVQQEHATEVDLVAVEWDHQAREFMRRLPKVAQ